MTDFGVRGEAGDATAENQATQITAEEAIQAAAEGLTKQTSVIAVNAQVFNNVLTTYTSAEIDCAGYRKFLLRNILTVTLTPTTIQIIVQFSQGGATYEDYVQGPFGSLMYEDSAGAKAEAIPGKCLGAKMKIYVVAVGTDATNKFTLTSKVILTR